MGFLSTITAKDSNPDKNWQPIDTTLRIKEVLDFQTALSGKVIGQPEAVDAFTDIYQAYLAGMSTAGRPIGNFLLLGPTGTGKTRIVEGVGETLLCDSRAVIKIDCAEFQHSHEIAKLIGSPPGYLGHRETHPLLSQEVLNQFHTEKVKLSLVLFDEIEKASDALWNLLLGILDKARLTLGDNRRVDFSRTIIACTSNVGAAQMFGRSLGFVSTGQDVELTEYSDIRTICLESARRKFTPEFLNRFDHIVPFRPLNRESIDKILDLELRNIREALINAGAIIEVSFTDAARQFLIDQGFDKRYGARELKRALQRHVVKPLSAAKITRGIATGDLVKVGVDPSGTALTFAKFVK